MHRMDTSKVTVHFARHTIYKFQSSFLDCVGLRVKKKEYKKANVAYDQKFNYLSLCTQELTAEILSTKQ